LACRLDVAAAALVANQVGVHLVSPERPVPEIFEALRR
jgi:hypothetical protein